MSVDHRRSPDQPLPPFPLEPVRLLIEDPALVADDVERSVPETTIDVTVCAGPQRSGEVCPLVTGGVCPFGPLDVVARALDGPWAPSNRAAWAATSTPVVDTSDVATADPAVRLAHHCGAALQRVWTSTDPEDDPPG